jgi:transposase-like protein
LVDLLDRYSKQEHWLEEFNQILEMPRTGPPQPHGKPKQVQRRLQPDEILDLVAAYQAGTTITDLAKQFQIHPMTVTAHLQRQGVKLRQRGLTQAQIEEAAKLYADGWSLTRIGNHFGVYPHSVRYRLRQAGVQLRPRPGWRS